MRHITKSAKEHGNTKEKVSEQEQGVFWLNSYLSEFLKYVKRAECPTSCETERYSISINLQQNLHYNLIYDLSQALFASIPGGLH